MLLHSAYARWFTIQPDILCKNRCLTHIAAALSIETHPQQQNLQDPEPLDVFLPHGCSCPRCWLRYRQLSLELLRVPAARFDLFFFWQLEPPWPGSGVEQRLSRSEHYVVAQAAGYLLLLLEHVSGAEQPALPLALHLLFVCQIELVGRNMQLTLMQRANALQSKSLSLSAPSLALLSR